MILLAKLIAIAFIILGCVIIMKRGTLKKMVEYIKEGNRIYGVAAGRIVAGVIFIAAAIVARSSWIVTLVGWLLVVSGVLVFVLKKEKSFEMLDKIAGNSKEKTVRMLGAIPVVVGVLLLCAL